MNGKETVLAYVFLLSLCEVFSALLAVSAVGWSLVLVIMVFVFYVLLPFGGRSAFIETLRILAVVFVLMVVLANLCSRLAKPNLSFPDNTVVRVEGRLIADSSFSKSGNHLMKVAMTGCSDGYGDTGSASGVIAVVGGSRYIISYGIEVQLEGRFRDGLFICQNLQVVKRRWLNDLRERIVERLEYRMLGSDCTDSDLLSCSLILGRDGDVPLKEAARLCGCSHVLALSGMHLGVLNMICLAIFGKRRMGRVVSTAAVLCFVFIAGPRPSLVRAAILFLIPNLGLEERTLLCFLVQSIMFPYTVADIGCCYGYMAVAGIVFVRPYFVAMLRQVHSRLLVGICMTACILVFSIPLQMVNDGQWHPICLLLSTVVGALAVASMVMGLLVLVFGRVGLVLKANGYIHLFMEKILFRFRDLPGSGWLGYVILVLSLLLIAVLYLLWRRALRHKVFAQRTVIDLMSVPNVNSKP